MFVRCDDSGAAEQAEETEFWGRSRSENVLGKKTLGWDLFPIETEVKRSCCFLECLL